MKLRYNKKEGNIWWAMIASMTTLPTLTTCESISSVNQDQSLSDLEKEAQLLRDLDLTFFNESDAFDNQCALLAILSGAYRDEKSSIQKKEMIHRGINAMLTQMYVSSVYAGWLNTFSKPLTLPENERSFPVRMLARIVRGARWMLFNLLLIMFSSMLLQGLVMFVTMGYTYYTGQPAAEDENVVREE